jgi:hypothetical protein
VTGASGSVNMPASEKEAQEVARELNSHSRGTQALVASGARYCLSPENFILQPSTFTKQVGALSPGQATILAESYGYQVVEVRSRVEIPYSNAIAGDIEIVTAKGGSQAEPNGDTPVIDILKAAKVDVNSEYGTWATTIPAPYPPEVLPPGESA